MRVSNVTVRVCASYSAVEEFNTAPDILYSNVQLKRTYRLDSGFCKVSSGIQ